MPPSSPALAASSVVIEKSSAIARDACTRSANTSATMRPARRLFAAKVTLVSSESYAPCVKGTTSRDAAETLRPVVYVGGLAVVPATLPSSCDHGLWIGRGRANGKAEEGLEGAVHAVFA